MKTKTREQLIQAALECLEQGDGNATAEDIAAKAGISRSSFYRYFKGMDELVTAIAVTWGKRNLKESLEISRRNDDTEFPWTLFIFSAVKNVYENPLRFLLEHENQARAVDLVYRTDPEVFAELTDIIQPALEQDQRQGLLNAAIDGYRLAEWLLRQVWCLSSAPPPGGWTDQALMECIRTFLIPALLPTTPAAVSGADMTGKLDRILKSVSAIETRLLKD